jgi:hypothetical protein
MHDDPVDEIRRKAVRILEEMCVDTARDSFHWSISFHHPHTGHGDGPFTGLRVGLKSGLLSSTYHVNQLHVRSVQGHDYSVKHQHTETFDSLEAAIQNLNYRAERMH